MKEQSMKRHCDSSRIFVRRDDNYDQNDFKIDGTTIDPMDVFRKHFESRFESIDIAPSGTVGHIEREDDDWNGISDEDEEDYDDDEDEEEKMNPVQIVAVKHLSETVKPLMVSKREKKMFMSSKPPSLETSSLNVQQNNKHKSRLEDDGNDEEDSLNLKNDLALQRLLRESHLLEPLNNGAGNLEAFGKNRLLTVTSRIEALGGRSIPTQTKMPMVLRKGIAEKKVSREKKRRREARENGIVLEKEIVGDKALSKKKRDRGFAPAVGKFRNGALVLSKKDVADITGNSNNHGKRRDEKRKSLGRKRL